MMPIKRTWLEVSILPVEREKLRAIDFRHLLCYVQYDNEKGEAMFHVKMSKALYGMLKSALWFYKKLKVDLEAYVGRQGLRPAYSR